ncbi:unnamed protein product [Cylicocyclus nassatus]|uniref:Replication protein A subunit n=1 Tax=Cylicocyclus nassatus TaxID=53992 RepID=A0AA36DKT9_CYLNA|nr:unnamed protein product [Cylicocyclus nassatus]
MSSAYTPAHSRKYDTNGQLRLSTGFFQRYFESDGTNKEIPILQVTLVKKLEEGSTGYPEACFLLRLTDGLFTLFVAASLESQCVADGIVGNSENGGEIIAVTGLKINRDCYIGKSGAKTSGIPMLVITGYELLSRGHPIFSAGISHAGDKDTFYGFISTQSYSVPWSSTSTANESTYASQQDIPPTAAQIFDNSTNTTSRTGADALKVFSFEITDKDGVAIRVSAFNDVAERASEIIQLVTYTYYITGASVKQANKRFNNTGHDYELIMNASTVIDRCRAGIPIPPLVLKICLLDDVPSHKNENINVLAVVDEIHQVNKFTSRQGQNFTKRDIHLVDQSSSVVKLTLWGEQAEIFQDHVFGEVVSIKGARVKEWMGAFSLAVGPSSKIVFSPQMDGALSLSEWYANKRRMADVKFISTASFGRSDGFDHDLCLIGTVNALQLGNEVALPNGRFINLKAMLTTIRTDTALYQSCPNDGCSKKVVQLSGGHYRCGKCNVSCSTFKWAYMIQAELTDFTGSIWVSIFSNIAAKMLGMEAEQLAEMKAADQDAYVRLPTSLCFTYYNWRINAN